jgi:hypothetical protein
MESRYRKGLGAQSKRVDIAIDKILYDRPKVKEISLKEEGRKPLPPGKLEGYPVLYKGSIKAIIVQDVDDSDIKITTDDDPVGFWVQRKSLSAR